MQCDVDEMKSYEMRRRQGSEGIKARRGKREKGRIEEEAEEEV